MSAARPTAIPPALSCLNRRAEVSPVIMTHTREQTPIVLSRLASIIVTLAADDYSLLEGQELFAVKRKTVADFVACCMGDNRARFFRGLHRLRGFRFKRLLIIGTRAEIEAGNYRSRIAPAAVLATLGAIEARFDVPVHFAESTSLAALDIEGWAFYFAREQVETVNNLARAHGHTRHTHKIFTKI